MCCRTQLAPMRQVGQVGATRTTSVGSRDAALKTRRSSPMLVSWRGDAATFLAAASGVVRPPPQPATSSNARAAIANEVTGERRALVIPPPFPLSVWSGGGVVAIRARPQGRPLQQLWR